MVLFISLPADEMATCVLCCNEGGTTTRMDQDYLFFWLSVQSTLVTEAQVSGWDVTRPPVRKVHNSTRSQVGLIPSKAASVVGTDTVGRIISDCGANLIWFGKP